MPFLIGSGPIRRTIKYLEQGKLIFREKVKIMTINYSENKKHHEGASDFAFWHHCQIQYKNPDVQIVFMKNLTPTPFLRFWLDSGEDVIMDVFDKSSKDIMAHVIKILGKSESDIQKELLKQQDENSIALFGRGRKRFCICQVPGQLPCPGVVRFPERYTGKYRHANNIWTPVFE